MVYTDSDNGIHNFGKTPLAITGLEKILFLDLIYRIDLRLTANISRLTRFACLLKNPWQQVAIKIFRVEFKIIDDCPTLKIEL